MSARSLDLCAWTALAFTVLFGWMASKAREREREQLDDVDLAEHRNGNGAEHGARAAHIEEELPA